MVFFFNKIQVGEIEIFEKHIFTQYKKETSIFLKSGCFFLIWPLRRKFVTGFEEDDEMPSGPPGEHWQEFEP